MNSKLIERIANSVLYEGYMLYPYRPSSVKNRQRWNFGVIYPKLYSVLQKGADSWFMQTQCLACDTELARNTHVNVRVRFLHAVSRQIGKLANASFDFAGEAAPDFEIVDSLTVGGRVLQSWQEVIERDVVVASVPLNRLLSGPVEEFFTFPEARELEPVIDPSGAIVAYIVRTRGSVSGCVQVSADECKEGIYKLTVLITNLTAVESVEILSRDDVLLRSLLSAHTILGVSGGEFISSIDPPDALREFVAECKNIGTWPVLAGEENRKDAMLSSPIILYDYPEIAPESQGDLFDGTEIDEILSLRILTLSDEEKREIRQSDDRAREVLERTESMPAEHFMKLHGALRSVKPLGEIRSEDRGSVHYSHGGQSSHKEPQRSPRNTDE